MIAWALGDGKRISCVCSVTLDARRSVRRARTSAFATAGVTRRCPHSGEDIGPGLLRAIERDLEPCLGKRWLKPWKRLAINGCSLAGQGSEAICVTTR
jgi:hypothetical protein